MGAAYFYHLTRSAADTTVQALLGKSLAAGWRVVVRGQSDAMLARLDDLLWLRPDDGFLPHGRAGGDDDAEQSVLLTKTAEIPNKAACVISVEGAEVSAEDVQALERVCILFDGQDEAALNHARGQWKALTAAGCAAQYWSEESGKWKMMSESTGA